MKKAISLLLLFITGLALHCQAQTITISKAALRDKIMGGWAGQTIGVTFGGPYEFRFQGTFIQSYQPLVWNGDLLKQNMLYNPGLYDDLYMDLTFVDVIDKYGIDAPVDSFANAFAHAGYMLWHANQAARYNILNGIKAPRSGYWMNSPHADDIDYQIESDYAGLMNPGMPNSASRISDKVGHIMNYGDGWYGGVFIGAMYTLAFTSNDIQYIVSTALKTIPAQSKYYKCITDVINWHKQYADWHETWLQLQKKWSGDLACPEGVFNAFDIDATINSAYVVMALLYGNGDYSKTLDIAARAGQDADCNPSSAGGVLGTMLGYKNIPAYWKQGLKEVEDIDFKYTTMSLNKVYETGFKHALNNIERNGGTITGDNIVIKLQAPQPVRFEESFPGMYPVTKDNSYTYKNNEIDFTFDGNGFALAGDVSKKDGIKDDYTFIAEVYIDGSKTETVNLPSDFTTRRYDLCWKYGLENKKHTVSVKITNPKEGYSVNPFDYIVYRDKPEVNDYH
ncbi:MAG TPA: ADP-ribosylglycohydrolase family protein [Chitinophagaceae bacterium]|nr:ADP-ribosylglycohydrolase family protein [Chitinophagaceae bacterium]